MKKAKPGALNTPGIVVTVILAVVMIIHRYNQSPGAPFYERILNGVLCCLGAFLGSGLIILVLFFVYYAAEKVADELFIPDEEKSHEAFTDTLTKYSNQYFVICFAVAYIVVFLYG